MTCCSREGSPRKPAGSVAIDVSRWIPLASALGRTASTAARAIVPRSIGCVSRRSLPVMMRETSRMSSISTACALALRSIVSSALRDFSGDRLPERNIPVHPTIAASGVRSSCDSVARNSSLARLAASASSRACRSRSTTRAYSSSARFWLSMSAAVTIQPITAPPSSRSGTARPTCQRNVPSVARRRRHCASSGSPRANADAHAWRRFGRSSGCTSAAGSTRTSATLGQTGVLGPGAVAVVERAVGAQRPDRHRHRVDEPLHAQLAAAPQLLALALAQGRRLRLDPLLAQEDVDEHRHLGPQDARIERLRHVVDAAVLVAARDVGRVAVDRGDEDDRDLRGARVCADQRRGLEPVELRHLHVEQDHRELVDEQRLQRLAPRAGAHQPLAERRQRRLERHQVRRVVVYQQD